MSTLRLEAVERIHIPAERAAWDQAGRRHAQPVRTPRRRPRERLVEATLAGTDPETCEIEMVLDSKGILVAVVIRDIASGAELARVDPAVLAALEGSSGDGGMLLERRG
jgi:hypothetical protein